MMRFSCSDLADCTSNWPSESPMIDADVFRFRLFAGMIFRPRFPTPRLARFARKSPLADSCRLRRPHAPTCSRIVTASRSASLSTLTRPRFARPAAAVDSFHPATPRLGSLRSPNSTLADSSRHRRPEAPPVRSTKSRQGPGGYALSTLTRFCSAHPATTGLRAPASASDFISLSGRRGGLPLVGGQTNRPSFQKDCWGPAAARRTLGNPAETHLGDRL